MEKKRQKHRKVIVDLPNLPCLISFNRHILEIIKASSVIRISETCYFIQQHRFRLEQILFTPGLNSIARHIYRRLCQYQHQHQHHAEVSVNIGTEQESIRVQKCTLFIRPYMRSVHEVVIVPDDSTIARKITRALTQKR